MENAREETIIDIPWDIVDECNGFSLDIGGSVMKFAYIHKADWIENPSNRKTDTCPVRLVNFAREEMGKSFEYLKDKMLIKRKTPDDRPLIYTTGIGGSQFMKQIKEEFQVTTENLTEMDLFVQCHRYLMEYMTREKLVHPYDKLGTELAKNDTKDILRMVEKFKSDDKVKTGINIEVPDEETSTFKFLQEQKVDGASMFIDYNDILPCFLVMCGSGGAVMTVNKDGTFRPIEMLYRLGRAFYGLGCILTGAKSYAELMEMAEKGTDKTVHTYTSDLQEGITAEDDSMYAGMVDTDFPAFLFGKGVQKTAGDFKKEDLARALIFLMVTDVVQTVYLQLLKCPVKHVFFCGNFVNHPLTRTLITAEWIKRDFQNKIFYAPDTKLVDLHFVRHGAHYGALGGLLNHKLKFTEQMAEMAAKDAANKKTEEETRNQANNTDKDN